MAGPRPRARTGPLPLLVDIHGGPHNAWNAAADEIHFYHQELAARGWAILLVNPRGSDGYGEEFYDGVHGAWGVADANDFLEPIDQLVAEGLADPERLAVAGYSYGGFMTCYLTGHDDRFAAAVAGGVVSDLVSMGGTCDDGHFLSAYELGGAPWQEPEPLRRDVAADQGRRRADAHARHPRRRRPHLPGRPGPAVAHRAARARACRPSWCSTRTPRHVFILLGPPSQRLDFNRRVLDWVEQHAVRGGRARVDARALGAPPRDAGRSGTSVPGAQLGILRYSPGREDELVEAAYGTLNLATGIPGDHDSVFQIGSITKVWTATVVLQLVDEGLVELDTPVVEVRARAPARRPRRHQAASPSGTCSPTPAASTATSSPTPVAATTAWRSTSTLLGRGGPEPPARRDLVLLQLRLLAARPGDREAHRHHLGPGDARPAVHAARARPRP